MRCKTQFLHKIKLRCRGNLISKLVFIKCLILKSENPQLVTSSKSLKLILWWRVVQLSINLVKNHSPHEIIWKATNWPLLIFLPRGTFHIIYTGNWSRQNCLEYFCQLSNCHWSFPLIYLSRVIYLFKSYFQKKNC